MNLTDAKKWIFVIILILVVPTVMSLSVIYNNVDVSIGPSFSYNNMINYARYGDIRDLKMSLWDKTDKYECKQEYTNQSNNCTNELLFYGLPSGDVAFPEVYMADGDFSSAGRFNILSGGIFYVNYSIPFGALNNSNVWRYKVGFNKPTYNYTVNESCTTNDFTYNFKIEGFNSEDEINISCYNSTGYQYINSIPESEVSQFVYEEAMIWNITPVRSCKQNLNNVSTACGGVSSGTYLWGGNPADWTANYQPYMTDNDITTSGGLSATASAGTQVEFYVNYTIPRGVHDGIIDFTNDELLPAGYNVISKRIYTDCLNSDKLRIKVNWTRKPVGFAEEYYCYDSSSNLIRLHSDGSGTGRIYEISVNWSIINTTHDTTIRLGDEVLAHEYGLFDFNNYQINKSSIINKIRRCNCTYCMLSQDYCTIPINISSNTTGLLSYNYSYDLYYNITIYNESDYQIIDDSNINYRLETICDNETISYELTDVNFYYNVTCNYTILALYHTQINATYFRTLTWPHQSGAINFYMADLNAETVVQVLITINDLTGAYTDGLLKIKTADGNKEIISQYMDAENKIIAYLIKDKIYSLTITNNYGVDRTLGYFIPDSAGEKIITVPTIEFIPSNDYDVPNWQYSLDGYTMRLIYNDTNELTTYINYSVFYALNGTLITSTVIDNPAYSTFTYAGNNETDYILCFEAQNTDKGTIKECSTYYLYDDGSPEGLEKLIKFWSALAIILIVLLSGSALRSAEFIALDTFLIWFFDYIKYVDFGVFLAPLITFGLIFTLIGYISRGEKA